MSTCHGIPNMIKASHISFKIIWLTFFIISTGLGSYYVIDSLLDYLRFQTVANIKVIQENQVPTIRNNRRPS